MLRSLSLLLILSLSLYWYATVGILCPAPLSYHITAPIDERFGLTAETAAATVEKAVSAWEGALGRDLFYPVAPRGSADVEIRFVFDDRQERALAEESLRESLETKQHTSSDVQSSYDALVATYNTAKQEYATAVAAYEAELSAHNDRVASYNATGGAPADVFATLQVTEGKLAAKAKVLDAESDRLATLAAEINDLGEQGNQIINQYNAGVNTYNNQFGEPDEFTQGDYQNGLISIYTFADTAELELVLAHELGHALSLPHVEGSASIMYYLLEDQPTPLVLSESDVATLVTTCGETGTTVTWIRTIINRYLF